MAALAKFYRNSPTRESCMAIKSSQVADCKHQWRMANDQKYNMGGHKERNRWTHTNTYTHTHMCAHMHTHTHTHTYTW